MKPPVDRAATAAVLAGIDAVLRERTAAAVERVLATASPAHGLNPHSGTAITMCAPDCPDIAECRVANHLARRETATPGMTTHGPGAGPWNPPVHEQRKLLAPEVISAHLFAEVVR